LGLTSEKFVHKDSSIYRTTCLSNRMGLMDLNKMKVMVENNS
jgi:hypothetical protein